MHIIDIMDKFIQIGKRSAVVTSNSRIIVEYAYIELKDTELLVNLPIPQMSDAGFDTFNRILAELYYGGLISANYVVRYCPTKNSAFQHNLRLLCITSGVKCCVESDGLYHIPLASREVESQYEQPKDFEDMLCVL